MAKITIDSGKLDAMIEAKIRERLAAGEGPSAAGVTPEEWQAGVDELKGKSVPATPQRLIPCKSDTGATFKARVVMSRAKGCAEGRIVGLEEYREPEEASRHQADGGLVPDGMQMQRQNGTPEKIYRQWRWENFWQADLRHYVGRPFDRRMLEDRDAELPPWTVPGRSDDEAKEAAAE